MLRRPAPDGTAVEDHAGDGDDDDEDGRWLDPDLVAGGDDDGRGGRLSRAVLLGVVATLIITIMFIFYVGFDASVGPSG